MTDKTQPLLRRIDATFLFSAENSKCNGEPNDGGRPRIDPETDHLLWNDAALKRFFRDGLIIEKNNEPGWAVQQRSQYPLNRTQTDAMTALGIDFSEVVEATEEEEADADGDAEDEDSPKKSKAKKGKQQAKKRKLTIAEKNRVLAWSAKNFADIRWFGAVLDTGHHCGNLTGPLQFMIARSVHPGTILEQGITRVTSTREDDFAEGKDRDMGTKFIVPFALFRGGFFYTPSYGEQTGFSVDDLEVFCGLFKNMFTYRQSAGLGLCTLRKAWFFVHPSSRGTEQTGQLFDRVTVECSPTPRSMKDISITFDNDGLDRKGIEVYTEENMDAMVEQLRKRPKGAA